MWVGRWLNQLEISLISALIELKLSNKTKVLSVQLGKTLSFVKFVGEWGGEGWGGGGALDSSSLTLQRPTNQILDQAEQFKDANLFTSP